MKAQSFFVMGLLWGSFSGLVGAQSLPSPLPPLQRLEARGRERLDWTDFSDLASNSGLLYLGERHDLPLDHLVQLTMFRDLIDRYPGQVKLAVEMAQIPYQSVLDSFVEGRLSLAQLPGRLDWTRTWGFDFAMYSPVFDLCQQAGVPIQAMRFSSASSKRLGGEGLAALSVLEREGIGAVDSDDFSGDPQDVEALRGVYREHAGKNGSEEGFKRFLRVQVLWEEGMAAQIVSAYRPGIHIVVLVGAGHLTLGRGLPARVSRRIRPTYPSRVLLVDPTPEEKPRADLIWWS